MAQNGFLSLITSGTSANRPTTVDPLLASDVHYHATDTGVLSYWDDVSLTWTVIDTYGVTTGLVASTTQTLAAATQLVKALNLIATSATSGNAVKLPQSPQVGQSCEVINSGANPVSVFPGESATTIDGGSAGAAVTLTNAFGVTFICSAAGAWISTGRSAKSS